MLGAFETSVITINDMLGIYSLNSLQFENFETRTRELNTVMP